MIKLFALFFMVLSLSNIAKANEINSFIGKWSVHTELTFEEVKQSPKFKPEEAEMGRKMLNRISKIMQLEIKETSMAFQRGKKITEMPYIIKASSPNSFEAEMTQKGKNYILKFKLIEKKYLSFKSSGSHDMDFYIWKRSVAGEEVGSELGVITKIIQDEIKND